MEWQNKRLLLLIKHFIDREISVNEFTDEFHFLYDLNTDYDKLTNIENDLYSSVSEVVFRFSSFEADHLSDPGAFTTEEQVMEAAQEAYTKITKGVPFPPRT